MVSTEINKAIFVDKDGTLIPDIPYNVDPQLILLEYGVLPGLLKLQAAGFLVIIISNQSGVARGLFEEDQLHMVQLTISELLKDGGVALHGFYYCPHHPDGIVQGYAKECICRKPKPGLILKAAGDFEIDLSSSWMIGDILHDVEAGNRAGCHTILINNGNETEWIKGEYRNPDSVADNFLMASEIILSKRDRKS